ncbi:septum formation initiator family protein [Candidatus Roizmanbacteria bacterium]|nr:MAG: septum formation initiator family protein [Candidatus Roizmanbacteria bacterium]
MQRIKRLLLYLLILFFITSLTRSLIDYGKNQQFYQDYKNEYENEKKRNVELKTQLVKSQDINEFEKIVRDKLNLHKSNEYILVIPNPTPTVLTPTPTPVPNYQQWIDVFK